MKKKNVLNGLIPETAAYVVAHAKWRASRGKNPSMTLSGINNPRIALKAAQRGGHYEKPVCMRGPKQKLNQLDRIMGARANAMTVEFGKYLSTYLADTLVTHGFVLGCELALYDLENGINGYTGKPIVGKLVGHPGIIYRFMSVEIAAIAEAVFPPEFALGVRTVQEEILRDVQQKAEAEKAKAVAKQDVLSDEELMKVFVAAHKIADLSYEHFTESSSWLEDRRKEGVNPFYHQTTGGLFIEQYYGILGSIWTPWGEWGCWGSGSSNEELTKAFLEKIGAVEVIPVKHTSQGTFGPVYAITNFEGIELPAPKQRERAAYIEYEEANKKWGAMKARLKNRLVPA